MSDKTKAARKVGMAKDKHCVYMQMINFDHSVGKFKDLKPKMSLNWGESIFVLCDAFGIVDVFQKLSSTKSPHQERAVGNNQT